MTPLLQLTRCTFSLDHWQERASNTTREGYRDHEMKRSQEG
jgi:hypothetical protein